MFHLISFFYFVLYEEFENIHKNFQIDNMYNQSNIFEKKIVQTRYNLSTTKLHEILHLQEYQKAY